jgi:hypothetical protein
MTFPYREQTLHSFQTIRLEARILLAELLSTMSTLVGSLRAFAQCIKKPPQRQAMQRELIYGIGARLGAFLGRSGDKANFQGEA